MKKQLLLGALFLGSLFTSQAQGLSCAEAEDVASGETYTVSSFEGTGNSACWNLTTANNGDVLTGSWYKFTATENGYLTLTSAVDANPAGSEANPTGIDTRVSVFTGTCDALTCYNGNDDVATDDYRSEVTIPVAANTTYYISWDNYWQAQSFDFDVTFEAGTCFYPNDISVGTSNVGTTSFTVSWDEALNSPESYQVLYGPYNFDPATEGELISTADTSVIIDGQEIGAGINYYIRSVCDQTSSTYSEWIGPFFQLLVTTLPYENNFDTSDENPLPTAGYSASGFSYDSDTNEGVPVGTLSDTPENFFISSAVTTGTTDKRLFIRPIYLGVNEQITVGFMANYFSQAGATGTFEVTIGTSREVADQTVIGDSFELEGSGTVAYNEFLTAPYTVPAAGIYYIAIHNISEAAASSFLFIDTLVITSELGTGTVASNKLSVYPNPSTDVVNVANAGLINNIKVTDLNGRTVKAVAFDGVDAAQVSIADLASGVYMMTVASDKGTNTTKIVKN